MASTERVADVSLSGDGLLVCRYRPEAVVSLDEARSVVDEALHLVRGPRPTLTVLTDAEVQREARDYLAVAPETGRVSSQVAVVVGSPIERMLRNLAFAVNKPALPTRAFDREDDAVRWLKGFLDSPDDWART